MRSRYDLRWLPSSAWLVKTGDPLDRPLIIADPQATYEAMRFEILFWRSVIILSFSPLPSISLSLWAIWKLASCRINGDLAWAGFRKLQNAIPSGPFSGSLIPLKGSLIPRGVTYRDPPETWRSSGRLQPPRQDHCFNRVAYRRVRDERMFIKS